LPCQTRGRRREIDAQVLPQDQLLKPKAKSKANEIREKRERERRRAMYSQNPNPNSNLSHPNHFK
jgi:hypothetical protein